MAHGNGTAYVYGGKGIGTLGYTSTILPGMIHFDMNSRTFSNDSIDLDPTENPLFLGAMEFIPYFGSEGLLIVLGGSDNSSLVSFGSVRVYDIAAGAWYNQTTTGDNPAPRVEFCTAGLPSSRQTYEMLVPILFLVIAFDTRQIWVFPC